MDCAVFDLETTDLSAVGSGFILCAVIKPLRGKPKIYRYDEMHCRPGHEKRLLQAILDELGQYDLWIGHNAEKFDFAFLKSRATILGLPFPYQPFIYDTAAAFRRIGLLTTRNPVTGRPKANLDHVVDFFGLQQKKTPIYPREHWKTVWESGKNRELAMKYLVDHCVSDVEMNEEIYWKLLKADNVWGLRRKK
jgi:DNA polymerase elongation subunit (family B)